TANGARTARDLAFHFASRGLTITSGLAVGIDAASHGGALAALGSTIAVCATGLDRLYPDAHADLAERIKERGALVSEFPPGTPPIARHFVQRNRLISGLSLGVLVVEAAARSGSLTTARHAGEQGREVFAVPGSIHSPQSRGCHQLLRQGAVLVENADDVLREIKNPHLNQIFKNDPVVLQTADDENGRLDNPAEILLDALGFESTSLDALVASTGLSSTSLRTATSNKSRNPTDILLVHELPCAQRTRPMALLEILEFPDPRLRTRAVPVTEFDAALSRLIDDMFETMYAAPGIGLAASQVDVHRQLIVMDCSADRSEPLVFINPEILVREDVGVMEEG
ncbi:MAG: DNA-protecting protein DprA, partial [Gammaproteobacteria bacterium]|nr:DNA-protecting protein DprA [Gammaproteobacteria bacterium]